MKTLPRGLKSLSAALVAALALAPASLGQDRLKLTNGTTLVGKAVSYDASAKIVTFVTEAGATEKVPADQLDRLSAYKIAKARLAKGTPADEIKLAKFARDVNLYAYSAKHYASALKRDPGLQQTVDEERVGLRHEAAQYCLSQAKEEQQKGDKNQAEWWLTKLLEKLPNEPEAAEAQKMLSELYPENHAKLDEDLEKGNEDLLTGDLAKGKKYYYSMLAGIQDGRYVVRNQSLN